MTRRILFLDETSEIGGAEINLIALAIQLRKKDWIPEVVLPRAGPFVDLLRHMEIPVHKIAGAPAFSTSFYVGPHKIPNPFAFFLSLFQGLAWIIRLQCYFRQTKPAAVHTVSIWAHAFGGLSARLAGVPVVAHFQEIVGCSSGFGWYRRLLSWWATIVPHKIVCISSIVAEQFQGVPSKKVQIIWNTVDVDRFVPAKQEETITEKPFTIGTVGRITPWKGHHIALEVAKLLKEQAVTFQWIFVGNAALGSAAYYNHLQDLVRRWDLSEYVWFQPWVEDMPAFYQNLDLLVHIPTEPEPFGLVLAEAMACGLPVITSTGGGMAHLVTEGGGIVVPPKTAGPVVQAIEELWAMPEDRLARGKTARHFAEKTFSITDYTEQWLTMYQTLMRQPV